MAASGLVQGLVERTRPQASESIQQALNKLMESSNDETTTTTTSSAGSSIRSILGGLRNRKRKRTESGNEQASGNTTNAAFVKMPVESSDGASSTGHDDNSTSTNTASAGSESVHPEKFISLEKTTSVPSVVANPLVVHNVERHQADGISHKQNASALSMGHPYPWAPQGNSGFYEHQNPIMRLHNEILDFCRLVCATEIEMDARWAVVEEMKSLVASVWPGRQTDVAVFGSTATGLCLPVSDVDIVITGATDPGAGKKSKAKQMYKLAGLLRKRGLVSYIQVIAKARVPIIKLQHKKSGIHMDICFDQQSGLSTAKYIQDRMIEYPQLKPLTMVLKHFLKQREMNETFTGGVGSFLLQMMVLAVLQQRNSIYVPKNRHHQNRQPSLTSNLGTYLIDFFDFWGVKFNYSRVGVSIRNGGSFFRKIDRRELQAENGNRLAIENPDDPSQILGSGSFKIMAIRNAFQHAHQSLLEICAKSVQNPFAPTLLGSILRVDQDLWERRHAIDFDGGPT